MLYNGMYYGKTIIDLSPIEYSILELLINKKNYVVTYKEFKQKLNIKNKQLCRKYISRLRKKVKESHLRRKFKVVSSTESPSQKEILGTNSFIPGIAGLLCAPS